MGATIPFLAFLLDTHTIGKSNSGLTEGEVCYTLNLTEPSRSF